MALVNAIIFATSKNHCIITTTTCSRLITYPTLVIPTRCNINQSLASRLRSPQCRNFVSNFSQRKFVHYSSGLTFPFSTLATRNLTTLCRQEPVLPLPLLLANHIKMLSSTTPIVLAQKTPVGEEGKGSNSGERDSVEATQPTTAAAQVEGEGALSTKEKLKRAVKDYGATVIIFHVTMSLMSLGFFYLLVSSGLDVIAILGKIGISADLLQSKVTEEASKFVVAYAVHKIFAPLRITITLTATPLIVRKLRSMGILKQAVKAKSN